ncbi:DUF2922 domain-containing protein [Phascolarctobacterium sp.]|uniref:DUF2922 domain-containing protein n=1 Tax=Phascolarctobacterium sp. TaxID=2049039 RepID=UPI00386FB5C9
MDKTLELVFKTEEGSKKTISVSNPREDVTYDDAKAAMDTIVEKAVFKGTEAAGEIKEAYEARIRTSDVTVLL